MNPTIFLTTPELAALIAHVRGRSSKTRTEQSPSGCSIPTTLARIPSATRTRSSTLTL